MTLHQMTRPETMATRPRNVGWVIGLDCDVRRIVVCIICRFVAGLTIVEARCRFDEFGSKTAGVGSAKRALRALEGSP